MKKIKRYGVSILSVLLFLSTLNVSAMRALAQEDVTKVNRTYSADTVVTGSTTPNTRVKYVGPNNGDRHGGSHGVFSAVSNSAGVFKMFVGSHFPNSTYTINTYDSNGNIIESDEVFVLKASLDSYLSLSFGNTMIYDQGEVGQVEIGRPMAYLYYRASRGSKIEVLLNDKVIKTGQAWGDYSSVDLPEIHLGDFVKVRVSMGSVNKTYELLATPYDIYDQFMIPYPISTSKVTSWSDSIRFYLPPKLKYSGLLNTKNDLYSTGVIKQAYDGKTTSIPLTLYDQEFENVVLHQNIRLSTSPKPDIDPVSQIVKEVSGTATANSLITVLDEQGIKIGEGVTDSDGRFAVPVNQLVPDTVIKVETRMPNTDKFDYSYTSVEEVYIDEPSDNNAYISGQSSFGTEAEVFLLGTNSSSKSSKKSIGTFTISKGSKFKLYIGKQKASSILQVELKEYGKSLTLPAKTVKDKSAPVISGVKNKGIYRTDLKPSFNEGRATLDGKTYVKGTKISKEGSHKLIVKDNAGNSTTIVFTIDKKAPVITGVKNKGIYKHDLRPSFNEGKATLNGKTFVKGTKITKEGSHKLIVKDSAGNSTTIVFTIDKKAPSKPSVNKITSSSRTITGKGEKGAAIYVYKGKTRIGSAQVNSRGTYSLKIAKQKKGTTLTVYAADKAGNKGKSASVKVG